MRKWLKTLRRQCGLKQSEIAGQLNISECYYSLIEQGERQEKLNIGTAAKLAEIFNVTLDWIAEQELREMNGE